MGTVGNRRRDGRPAADAGASPEGAGRRPHARRHGYGRPGPALNINKPARAHVSGSVVGPRVDVFSVEYSFSAFHAVPYYGRYIGEFAAGIPKAVRP